jgi:hypothetical protein
MRLALVLASGLVVGLPMAAAADFERMASLDLVRLYQ